MSTAEIGLGTFYYYARKGGYDGPPASLMALAGPLALPSAMPPETSASASRLYPAYSLPELDALPEPRWLIDGILPENSLCMVYGPSGSLKTFLVLSWALNGAAGLPWAQGELPSLKGFEIARRLRVAIIAGEGAHGLRKRVKAWQKQNNVGDDGLDVIVIPEMPSFSLSENITRLIATINAKFGTVDVVIVDTVMRASSGLNINTPAESQTFIDACERIKRELGCTVVLVHHTGKDRERGHLGAENLKAAMDMMERVDLVASGLGLRVIRLRQEKAKDSEERGEIYLTGSLEVIGETPDGTEITSLVLNRCLKPSGQAKSAKSNLKLDTALKIIRDCTKPRGISTRELAEGLAKALEGVEADANRIESMRQWIGHQVGDGGALCRYASASGEGKTAARFFKCPPEAQDEEGALMGAFLS